MIKEVPAYQDLEKTIAQLTAQLKQRTEELAVISSVQEGLAKELDIQAIYDLVGNRIRQLLQHGYEKVAVPYRLPNHKYPAYPVLLQGHPAHY